jgi:hypothetical protein
LVTSSILKPDFIEIDKVSYIITNIEPITISPKVKQGIKYITGEKGIVLNYTSDDETVLFAGDNGIMTPYKDGSVTVLITVKGFGNNPFKSITIDIKLKPKNIGIYEKGIPISQLIFNNYNEKKDIEIKPVDEKGNPLSIDYQYVDYTSSVVSITDDTIESLDDGETELKVQSTHYTHVYKTIKIIVAIPDHFDNVPLSLNLDDKKSTEQIVAKVKNTKNEDITDHVPKVAYRSDNPSVAIIYQSIAHPLIYIISAHSTGLANIYLTSGKLKDMKTITVNVNLAKPLPRPPSPTPTPPLSGEIFIVQIQELTKKLDDLKKKQSQYMPTDRRYIELQKEFDTLHKQRAKLFMSGWEVQPKKPSVVPKFPTVPPEKSKERIFYDEVIKLEKLKREQDKMEEGTSEFKEKEKEIEIQKNKARDLFRQFYSLK